MTEITLLDETVDYQLTIYTLNLIKLIHCTGNRQELILRFRPMKESNLLLRTDVIVHENEVPIRRNEREDTL